jgi:lysozyme
LITKRDIIVSPSLKLKKEIEASEGRKNSAYQDSLGYWTIGIGRLIDARKGGKLSDDEINYLFDNDLRQATNELMVFNWFQELDEVRKGVLIELNFNIGLKNMLEFHDTIAAISKKDFTQAGLCLLRSKWAIQVGASRSSRMIHRLQTGTYPND